MKSIKSCALATEDESFLGAIWDVLLAVYDRIKLLDILLQEGGMKGLANIYGRMYLGYYGKHQRSSTRDSCLVCKVQMLDSPFYH
jgi:hypothetical protein